MRYWGAIKALLLRYWGAIKALLMRYWGASKALLMRYQGAITALLRRYQGSIKALLPKALCTARCNGGIQAARGIIIIILFRGKQHASYYYYYYWQFMPHAWYFNKCFFWQFKPRAWWAAFPQVCFFFFSFFFSISSRAPGGQQRSVSLHALRDDTLYWVSLHALLGLFTCITGSLYTHYWVSLHALLRLRALLGLVTSLSRSLCTAFLQAGLFACIKNACKEPYEYK